MGKVPSKLLAKLSSIPDGIQNASDYRSYAKELVPPEVWRYLEEGSGNQVTLQANHSAFERIQLMPRPMIDVRGGHTKITLFNQIFAHPIILAPLATKVYII